MADHQILIVGGGAAGIATATSLYKRDASLNIAIIEPSVTTYYQPGWTMVGAGVFEKSDTCRDMSAVWPAGVKRIKNEVISFDPKQNEVILRDGAIIGYNTLNVASGLKLDWDAVEGVKDALGQNSATAHYSYDLAPQP